MVAPPPDGSVQMSDEVKKDLVPSLHRLLASLTEIVHSEDNRTVLYVPSYFSGESAGEGLGPEAEAEIIAEMANDSPQVQQLEAVMVQWTRQVKELLLTQDATIDSADRKSVV